METTTKLNTNEINTNELSDRFTPEKLQIIASSDPFLARNEDLLIGHYELVKRTWSKAKLNNLKQLHSLNLRQKFDRCLLAVKAAEIQLQHYPTPTPEIDRQLEP